MNIKLHARLAAYSKIDKMQSTLPVPETKDAGKLLGVNSQGEYVLTGDVANTEIDKLFNVSSNNPKIDQLFEGE